LIVDIIIAILGFLFSMLIYFFGKVHLMLFRAIEHRIFKFSRYRIPHKQTLAEHALETILALLVGFSAVIVYSFLIVGIASKFLEGLNFLLRLFRLLGVNL